MRLLCKTSLKKTYFIWFFLGFLSVSLFSLIFSSNASAYSFGDVGNFSYSYSSSSGSPGSSWASSYFNPTDGSKTKYFTHVDYNSSNSAVVSIFNSNPSAGYLNTVQLDVISLTSGEYIPAHSLFSFSVRYAGLSGGNLKYNGISPSSNWTLLNDSCVQSASQTSNSNTYAVDFACTYYGYTEDALDTIRFTGYMVNFELNGLMVVVTPGTYVEVSADDGSSVIIDDISDDVGDILGEIRNNNTQNSYIYVRMADMMDLLQDIQDGQLTPQNIEDAVANANSTTMEEEREMLEEAAEEAQTQAESSGAQSEAQGTSLINVVSSFVSGLSGVTATNCVIDVDFSLYTGGTHNLIDLCPGHHTRIFTVIQTISGIILAVFILRAVIRTIEVMIALYREYQS